ncbi:MAG: Mth938-like domain-containing protein [Rubrivivax sp.]|nr:Mth938-like domain-containing protein [Rubrivivax sp.]
MKFQPDTPEGVNVITRHEPGRVWVGATAFDHSLLLPWSGAVVSWPAAAFDELGAAHFERVLALAPEVVIFGSGARLRFPPPAWLRALIDARIGVETMDTAAACRTYNVLASERRAVVAALLVDSGPQVAASAETL